MREDKRKNLLAAIFAIVLLSTMGVLSTEAFAQLSTSGITSTVGSVVDTVNSTVQSVTGTVGGLAGSGIVLNNVQSTSGSTDASNKITLSGFAMGSGTNEVLVVGVSANNNGVASVTYGGAPLTQATSSFYNNDAEVWYLTNPGSSGDIVVTMSGSTSAVVGAYAFANVDQSNPIPTTAAKHNTSSSSPSISLITKYPGDWVVDIPSIYGGSTLGSPTCTQEWNDNVPNEITGASSSRQAAFPAIVTCKWTASSPDMWDDVAVEVKAQGATILGINLGGSSGGSSGSGSGSGGSTSGGSNSTSGGTNSTSSGGTNSTSSGGGTNSTSSGNSTGITVYAHRIPASYWDPCFATTCSAGTGPGASMYFVLYDSSMNVVQTGYADENGYTFGGLNPNATYYVYPDDCDNCHGSNHDVVFQYWGDNHSSERPRAATVGAQLHAWYSCTNNCAN